MTRTTPTHKNTRKTTAGFVIERKIGRSGEFYAFYAFYALGFIWIVP
jgi:hypothetical protein